MLTLLLQATTPFLNILLGSGLAMVVGIVGWLLNRTIGAFDMSVKKTEEAVTVLTKLFSELHAEVRSGNQLVKYLEDRVDTLEEKKEILQKAFNEMDKIIDREIIHKKTHS
jgi:sensor domain CHASE-containing protein